MDLLALNIFVLIFHLLCTVVLWTGNRRYSAFSLALLGIIIYPSLIYIGVTEDNSIISAVQYEMVLYAELVVVALFTLGVVIEVLLARYRRRTRPTNAIVAYQVPGHVSVLIVAASLAGFYYYLQSLNRAGISLLVIMVARGIESFLDISFYPRWIASWVQPLVLLLFCYQLQTRQKKGAWKVITLLVVAAAWLLIQGGRKAFLDFLFLVWLISVVIARRQPDEGIRSTKANRPRIGVALWVIVGAIASTVFLTAYRSIVSATGDASKGFELLIGGSYGGLDTTGFLLTTNREHPHELPSIFDWVWAPIPRSMWPEKPYMLGGRVVEEMGYDISSYGGAPTVNFYGELYRMGGMAAMATGILALGLFVSALETRIKGTKDGFSTIVLLIAYVIGVNNLWITSLSDSINAVLMQVLPLFVIKLFSRRRVFIMRSQLAGVAK